MTTPRGTITARFGGLLLPLALVLPAGTLAGQSSAAGSPAWIVERLYLDSSWRERAQYMGGELAGAANGPTPGSRRPAGSRVTIRPLAQDAEQAVVAVATADSAATQDMYVYLRQDAGRWRAVAFRALALPPLFYEALDDAPPEFAAEIASMRLTTASDSALKAYFRDHRARFDALLQATMAVPAWTTIPLRPHDETAPDPARTGVRNGLRALHLTAAERDEEGAPGCLLFVIGGMLDNTVGYLHAPAGCQVPRMSPELYIYVEQVAPGWYLYKTT